MQIADTKLDSIDDDDGGKMEIDKVKVFDRM